MDTRVLLASSMSTYSSTRVHKVLSYSRSKELARSSNIRARNNIILIFRVFC